jgi:hypothetical protein
MLPEHARKRKKTKGCQERRTEAPSVTVSNMIDARPPYRASGSLLLHEPDTQQIALIRLISSAIRVGACTFDSTASAPASRARSGYA